MNDLVTVDAAGILFDMDGVLISSIASVNRCWRRWAMHYGVPGAESFNVPHGVRAVEIIARLRPDLDVSEGLRLIEDMEIEDMDDLKVLPGAGSLLAQLPADRWAIVTSATYRLLLGRLRAARLPIPARIVSGDSVQRGKPDPEPYLRGAQLIGMSGSGVSPATCLVVEDAPSGVAAGVAAGCRVLGVLGTHHEAELLAAGATWTVPSLEEVQTEPAPDGVRLTFAVR